MTPDEALHALAAKGNARKGEEMAAYHKVPRTYLGVANPVLDAIARKARRTTELDDRLSLASGLWRSNIHEARILAAKLLTEARIRPDDSGAWRLIASWVPDFDAWAIADHASIAAQKRLLAQTARVNEVEDWTNSEHMWTRRAALVSTLPWARAKDPSAEDLAIRERVLGWAARYVSDNDWFIQKSVAWWLRDLSKRDTARTRLFLGEHGAAMKPFARREAARYLS